MRLYRIVFMISMIMSMNLLSARVPLIPRSVLYSNPEKTNPQISPDGTMFAYCAPVAGVLNVWVKTLDQDDDRAITCQTHRGISSYHWSADSRKILYEQDNNGDENYHLFVVDLKTNQIQDMTPFSGVKAQLIAQNKKFPNKILVGLNKDNPRFFDVYELDLMTGQLTLNTKNQNNVVFWLADTKLQVRAALTLNADGSQTLLVRDQVDQPWRVVLSVGFEDTLKDELYCGLLSFSKDGNALYLNTSIDTNTRSLLQLDLMTGKRTLIATDSVYDVAAVTFNDDYEPETVWWEKDRLTAQVLDSSIAQDIAFIRTISDGNLCYIQKSDDSMKWIVCFAHDIKSHETWLYDRASQQATFLFQARPALNQYQLAPMKPISFVSRDGLTIHGYLSCPVDQEPKKLPLVLFVHGGPFWSDRWGFNPTAQLFANRGYACLQVNFRGSSGYGKAFLAAGNGEWGGKMHDDLIDAVSWSVEQGIADPKRIAIYGGSYGGYAALCGATFTPDVFCCAIDCVGVTNLITFLQTIPSYWFVEQWEKRTGKLSDETFLKSRSPLFHVDKIKIPILVAHGAHDVRVKQSEAEQIVAALKEKNLPYEYLLFHDEGHGFARPENRFIFYAAVEKFLAQYLGGRCEK